MEPFRIPDLSQPRYRVAAREIDGSDFYKSLCEKVPKAKALGHSNIKALIKEFNESITQYIMDNREGVELFESLGFIFIASCKTKNGNNIDFAKSKKYGVKVTHKNYETDGKLGKIFYTSYNAKYKMKDNNIWVFKPSRKFKRTVAKIYPEQCGMYMELTRNEKVSAMIEMMVKKFDKGKAFAIKKIEDYNEFDLND
jgi:nucleoid DNA-binding protein